MLLQRMCRAAVAECSFARCSCAQAHYCIALGVKDSSGLLEGFGFPTYPPPRLPGAVQQQQQQQQQGAGQGQQLRPPPPRPPGAG